MDFKIRKVKTASRRIAIQVYEIVNRKSIVLKHLGSANTEIEVQDLISKAKEWILNEQTKFGLFKTDPEVKFLNNYEYKNTKNIFAYEFLNDLWNKWNLKTKNVFKDLCIAQILEPSSKRQHLEYLEKQFEIKYNLNNLYSLFNLTQPALEEEISCKVLEVAKLHFGFDFSFVLYDVTTLYFESFKNDEFKRAGFSKDHKHNQPQVVIGLITTEQGFPIHYQVFKGNTFEGNTFLPIIMDFKSKHNIQNLTVVADSAMLSKQNLDKLLENKIDYIISARLASLKEETLRKILEKVKREDKFSVRVENLIVEYKEDRYKKDKQDLEKQIQKAKQYENLNTSKIKKLRFLKNEKTKYFLDQEQIDKSIQLLGLKGFVTNLDLSDRNIIDYYHNLFKIEHAFRIAKSDLEIRPIYHHKENSIKNHILICFVAMCISTFLELKTKLSQKQIIKNLKSVTDISLYDKDLDKHFRIRNGKSEVVEELEKLLY